MLFGIRVGRKPGRLIDADVLLVDALRLYEASLCPDCRHPTALMFNPRLERFLQFSEDGAVCNYCALTETRRADNDNPLQPGEKLVIDTQYLYAVLAGDDPYNEGVPA